MPLFFIVLGIAAVVLIATAGHRKYAHDQPTHHPPGARLVALDSDLPKSLVDQVLAALGYDEDPAHLDSLAHWLGVRYPLSARELQRKASALRAVAIVAAPSTAAMPALSAATTLGNEHAALSAVEQAAPAAAIPHDGSAPLDAATVLQAAMRALAQETDPVLLAGFAESIRANYPAAADLLAARALALSTTTTHDAPAAPAAAAAPPIEVPS
jgi:hypothetical protein